MTVLPKIYRACLLSMLLTSCAQDGGPPYFTAQVTDVYKQSVTVERFELLYWWEERGETPFLKPFSLTSKEVIFEVMQPLRDNPGRVAVVTRRVPFDALDTLAFELTDTGKQMKLTTKEGQSITSGMAFPRELKKDPQAGIADTKIFVQGLIERDGRREEYKLPIDYVKLIKITGINGS